MHFPSCISPRGREEYYTHISRSRLNLGFSLRFTPCRGWHYGRVVPTLALRGWHYLLGITYTLHYCALFVPPPEPFGSVYTIEATTCNSVLIIILNKIQTVFFKKHNYVECTCMHLFLLLYSFTFNTRNLCVYRVSCTVYFNTRYYIHDNL